MVMLIQFSQILNNIVIYCLLLYSFFFKCESSRLNGVARIVKTYIPTNKNQTAQHRNIFF